MDIYTAFSIAFTIVFSGCIILLFGIIIIKVFIKKKLPDNNYTPFDYITAQTNIEFHIEKEEKEEEADKGDDKYKNRKKHSEDLTNGTL